MWGLSLEVVHMDRPSWPPVRGVNGQEREMRRNTVIDMGAYIDDRALDTRSEDRFHLGALADQLATLVSTQRMPLSVAVFGPWGSGKSSLAKLLEEALAKESKSIQFVRIDAWKYSKDSFRRQFIMESARLLNLDAEEFRKELYEKSTHSELRVPWQALGRLAEVLAFLLGIIFGLVLLAGLLVAWVTTSSDETAQFWPALYEFMKGSAPAAILSASVLTALFAFLGKLFVSDVTQSEVASGEHFERVFKKLVKRATDDSLSGKLVGCSSRRRIVFYIDELDRCAAKDAVAVLEGIRTFLEVDHCVFVVAADNRVLELAVQEEMPHPVPDEEANPYYSSGAEYLDKLFQHQLTIPALLPHRLTAFALNLVTGRPGVWREAADTGELANVVSILVPSHVRSPRRVKVLLNGFTSLYEVARARHVDDSDGTPDPAARMLELAKLSTLRLEFPLFQRDLIRFPQLVTHLTAYVLNENDWPDGMEAKARAFGDQELVEKYAKRERPTDTMLIQVDSDGAGEKDTDTGTESEAVGAGSSETARRSELLAYLRKTAYVAGPSRDVVFLEGAGAPYGIAAELGDLIEGDAIDNNLGALARRVENLTDDARIGVMQLLHETRRHMIGVEATNTLSAAVHLIGDSELVDPSAVADDLVSDLALESTHRPLPVEWLPTTVKVGLVARSAEGRQLACEALRDGRLQGEENEQTAQDTLSAVGESLAVAPTEISDLLVGSGPGFIATAIADDHLSSTQLVRVCARTSLLDDLVGRWSGNTAEPDAEDFAALSGALRSLEEPLDWTLAARLSKSKRVDLIDAWLSDPPQPPADTKDTATLLSIVSAASREQWEAAESLFDEAPKTSSVALYSAVRRLYRDIDDGAPEDDSYLALRRVLERVWDSPAWPKNWSLKEPSEWVLTPAWSEGERRRRKQELARTLARTDSQPDAFWPNVVARGYEEMLLNPGATLEAVAEATACLPEDWLLLDSSSRNLVIEAIEDGAGLGEDVRRLWQAEVSLIDASVPFPFDAEQVIGLIAGGSEADVKAARLWLGNVASLDEARHLVSSNGKFVGSSLEAVIIAQNRFSPVEAARLAEEIVASGMTMSPTATARILESAGPEDFADWLAEALRSASNQSERARLLGVWAAWRPQNRDARRKLIDAYIHVASSGKGGLELAIKYIDLVSDPPKGKRKPLVDALAARASLYGLEKRVGQAMLRAGLVRTARKGLLRKAIVFTDDDE